VRWRHGLLGCAGLLGSPACYQPRPLDARVVLDEVADEQRTESTASTTPLPLSSPRTVAAPAAADARPAPAGEKMAPGETAGPTTAIGGLGEGDPRDAWEALTEDQAVARALRFNAALRARRHQLGMAEGQITAATALSNPTVELEWLRLESPADRAFSVKLAWSPPQPGVYAAKRDAARAQSAAVKSEISESEWEVVTAVRAAHANLVALAEQQRLVEISLVKRRRINELVRQRVHGGASTSIDLSLAQLSVADGEREREDLSARELEEARELGRLLGCSRPIRARGTVPEEKGPLPAYQSLVDTAMASRPALTAEQLRFLQREEEIRLERARRWPWFELTSSPRYRYEMGSQHPNDLQVGVRFTVPLLDQNAGPIRMAEAARDAEREQFRQQGESIRREIAAGLAEVAQRRMSLERYQRTVLPSLDAHEKLLNAAAQGGQIDVVAVLRAEDAVLRSRSEFVAVRLAHHQAWLRLDSATGRRVAPSPAERDVPARAAGGAPGSATGRPAGPAEGGR